MWNRKKESKTADTTQNASDEKAGSSKGKRIQDRIAPLSPDRPWDSCPRKPKDPSEKEQFEARDKPWDYCPRPPRAVKSLEVGNTSEDRQRRPSIGSWTRPKNSSKEKSLPKLPQREYRTAKKKKSTSVIPVPSSSKESTKHKAIIQKSSSEMPIRAVRTPAYSGRERKEPAVIERRSVAPTPPTSEPSSDASPLQGSPAQQLDGAKHKPRISEEERLLAAVKDMDCYHGVLPLADLKEILKREGDFLIRVTEEKGATGQAQKIMCLSILYNGKPITVQMGCPRKGFTTFNGIYFDSMKELLKHHIEHRMPVGDGNTIKALLKRPMARHDWELSRRWIALGQRLGAGAFGDVFAATLSLPDQPVVDVAVKTMRGDQQNVGKEEMKRFLKEARVMRNYRHRHLVRLIGVASDDDPLMLVMEFMPGGSLLSHLQKPPAPISLSDRLRYCLEAATGMEYLERHNCIHRDVAARNCLIGREQEIKISDFGLCLTNYDGQKSDNNKLPLRWLAPETLIKGEFSLKCDVWAFGVLIWEVFANGDQPYKGLTNGQVKKVVISKSPPLSMAMGTPVGLVVLAGDCWAMKAEMRPKFSLIIKTIAKIQKATTP